jgi:catechol 2,3-dioxygenase-like lactoylglutathione lyase family enzyme
MPTPFTAVHHLCLVVRDMDAAVAFYESVGIGPWQDYPPLSDYTDVDVPDPEGFMDLIYRFTHVGDLQVQLCQPGAGRTPQRRFLDAHGEGVFHIGFVVEDADAAERDAADLGLDRLMSGRRRDGSGFTYYDTADRAGGVVLLTRQNPSKGAP